MLVIDQIGNYLIQNIIDDQSKKPKSKLSKLYQIQKM